PAQRDVDTADLQAVLVLEGDVDTLDATVHRITFDQGAVVVRVIQREARVQAVDVVAAVDHRRGGEHRDGITDLRLVPVNSTADAVEQLMAEGRADGKTQSPGIALLVLQGRVAHHQGATTTHVPFRRIGVEVGSTVTTPGVDVCRTQGLQLGAYCRVRGVRVVQRRTRRGAREADRGTGGVVAAGVVRDRAELRATVGRGVQLRHVRRTLGTVVTAAYTQPVERVPAAQDLVRSE